MATIISLLCFAALAVPLLVQASSIAIISEPDDRSDAISKVIGALCEKKRGVSDEEGDDRGFCRHFQDASEVSSILARNPEAFEAVVTEVRMFLLADAIEAAVWRMRKKKGAVSCMTGRPSACSVLKCFSFVLYKS